MDGASADRIAETILFVRGRIRIVDAEGNVVREATRAAFCRCGGSGNKPFCDGTHRRIGFQS